MNKIRGLIFGICMSLLLTAGIQSAPTVAAQVAQVKVKVDGSLVNFPDAQPYIDESNSRTMVPARFVSEALGYQVFWNEATRKVIIHKMVGGKGFIVTLKVGENKAEVDGKVVTFDAKAVIKNDRTFVPLRFVSESFGADVDWIADQRLVVITTDDGAGTGNQPGTGDVGSGQPGTTQPPANGGETPQTPDEGEKIGDVIIKNPDNENWLLPASPETQPAVEEFLASLKLGDGVVTGKIPKIPDGYKYVVDYTDRNGKWGNPDNDIQYTKLKPGVTFSIPLEGVGGQISFSLADNTGAVKNGVFVQVPSMTAEWSAER
ncbi:copper amine oxidase N-terminal domain-containing protein [Brevibacillus humidisoli]|uniref:copper amine oxidase N-terminal domain-containing protein n=1 Tax=Brevibacillus humidisoli TaxID=2895522 RepID=UPI001E541EC1|nr:copper amine oxidase N-terminal domain-containing protein [Brevibacillus humidisoli]UFJ41325.1 copper amine oxidase N-terminal domain-containing protein [Brevibacillus humidisoli]